MCWALTIYCNCILSITIVPVSYLEKPMLVEARPRGQGHPASRWQSQDLNAEVLDFHGETSFPLLRRACARPWRDK